MRTRADASLEVPFADLWTALLAQERGAEAAGELMATIGAEYSRMRAERGPVAHRGLRRHLFGNILPQLAAYRTLGRAEGREAALATTQRLHFATLAGLKRRHAQAAAVPMAFQFYRLLVPWMLRVGHPAAGWDVEWAENSRTRIHAKVYRCFYQDRLEEYGAGELISIYCRGDDHVFGEVSSPHIRWTREKTRPRGDAYCDVRYERGPNARNAP
jgi:hypothetical protein